MSKNKFKKFIKAKINIASFKFLENLKKSHSKIKFIKYKKLEIQPYIKSEIFSNEEVKLLFSLRSRMTNVKSNFSSKFQQNLSCMFGCIAEENQNHLLDCESIQNRMEDKSELAEIKYSDLFQEIEQQVQITRTYAKIFKIREELIPSQPL